MVLVNVCTSMREAMIAERAALKSSAELLCELAGMLKPSLEQYRAEADKMLQRGLSVLASLNRR